MDTLGKLVFGACMVALAILALGVVFKLVWELGPVGVVLLVLVALGYLALRKPRE